jgi:hypothetical protein
MTHATPVGEKCHDTLATVTGRSGRGTARQTIRIDEATWERFGNASAAAGADRSAVLRDFIRWYVGEPGTALPERPEPPPEVVTG